MKDELETLVMNSKDDVYKLNSPNIGKKITSLDIRGVTKKEDRQRIIDIVTGLALGKKCTIKQINADGVFLIIPPSLKNIYKELQSDLKIPPPQHGNLEKWAKQGVLLLNSVLTVSAGKPASHQKIGWQSFTDAVIKNLSAKRKSLVFILWGKFAQTKIELIDQNKHLILKAAHPSPYSATYGFFGCKHFSKTNNYLKNKWS